ncbi:hypothetical protein BKA62DRAFT_669963 [Auriculariales sp. MPI-PUGE-AT-0066]|nr:hypothetical protein BKA62DRAFT_669963 [Auriculariales sp. MPI-PUGE-AT-0066]
MPIIKIYSCFELVAGLESGWVMSRTWPWGNGSAPGSRRWSGDCQATPERSECTVLWMESDKCKQEIEGKPMVDYKLGKLVLCSAWRMFVEHMYREMGTCRTCAGTQSEAKSMKGQEKVPHGLGHHIVQTSPPPQKKNQKTQPRIPVCFQHRPDLGIGSFQTTARDWIPPLLPEVSSDKQEGFVFAMQAPPPPQWRADKPPPHTAPTCESRISQTENGESLRKSLCGGNYKGTGSSGGSCTPTKHGRSQPKMQPQK